MPPAADAASVYSFLGKVAKDHGEIQASLDIVKVYAGVETGRCWGGWGWVAFVWFGWGRIGLDLLDTSFTTVDIIKVHEA